MYIKILFASVLLTAVLVANANHSWNNYHWARTGNSFTMKLGDNLTNGWKSYLNTSSLDWSLSSVLDTTIVPGLAGRNCSPRAGRAEITTDASRRTWNL